MKTQLSSLEISHFPVMLNEVVKILSPKKGGLFVDCTFGGGGYSNAILKFPNTKVIGIDIDIRKHNRDAIEAHPLSSFIQMIEGSSISHDVVEKVRNEAKSYQRIMVCLDSNHTHEHVLEELELYSPMTTPGNYCLVFDTIVEDLPADMFPDRPWGPGNNPKTAVWEFLEKHPEFFIDENTQKKLLLTVAPDGFLKRKY